MSDLGPRRAHSGARLGWLPRALTRFALTVLVPGLALLACVAYLAFGIFTEILRADAERDARLALVSAAPALEAAAQRRDVDALNALIDGLFATLDIDEVRLIVPDLCDFDRVRAPGASGASGAPGAPLPKIRGHVARQVLRVAPGVEGEAIVTTRYVTADALAMRIAAHAGLLSAILVLGLGGLSALAAYRIVFRPVRALLADLAALGGPSDRLRLEPGETEVDALVRLTRRQVAEIRELQERLDLVITSARVGIFDIHLSRGTAYWNDQLRRILGEPPDFVARIGALAEYLTPDARARWREFENQVVQLAPATPMAMTAEMSFTRRDGTEFWADVHINIQTQDGGLGRVVGSVRDITDRREGRERLDAVIEASNSGIFDIDFRSGEVYYSPLLRRQLGLSATFAPDVGDLVGRTHPEEVAELEAAFSELVTHGSARREFRLRGEGGQYLWMAWVAKARTDARGEIERIMGSISDISDRKWAEEQRDLSEQRYRAVVQASNAGIYDIDGSRGTCTWSASLRDMLGVSPDAVVLAGDLAALVHPDDRTPDVIDGTIETEAMTARELRLRRLDGVEIWVSWTVIALGRDGFGRERSIGSLTDVTARKEAERQRAEAETRIRLVVAATQLGVYDRDDVTGSLYWNDRLRQMLGVGDDHVPKFGDLAERCLDKDALSAWYETHEKAVLASDAPFVTYTVELRIRGAEDRPLWVLITACLIRGADGRAARVIGSVQDITDRRDAEERLRVSEERLRIVLEAANTGIFDEDPRRRQLYLSPVFKRLLGMPLEDPVAFDEISSRMAPETVERLRVTLDRADRPTNELGLVQLRRNDGRMIWIEFSYAAVYGPDGRIARRTGSVVDVTAREEAKRSLVDSERRLALLIEAAGAAIVDTDHGSGAVTITPRYREILGLPEDYAPTPNEIGSRVHPEDGVEGMADPVAIARDGRFQMECRLRRHDGTWVWVEMTGRVLAEDGEPRRSVVGIVDISRRRETEAELLETRVQRVAAEASAEAKSAFLANMSHELRTPLNAILNYSQLILEDFETWDQRPPELDLAIADVTRIRTSASHLRGLVDQILDLSKIEAGRLIVTPEAIDLGELLAEVSDVVTPLAAAKGLAWTLTADPDLGPVRADPLRLRQILLNLLSNAVKFTLEGAVAMTVAPAGPDQVAFTVSDTGIGMSEAEMAHLFTAYQQARGDIAHQFGGTGLGLALSKKLAEVMGGDIRVESLPDAGSTFTLILPRDTARATH